MKNWKRPPASHPTTDVDNDISGNKGLFASRPYSMEEYEKGFRKGNKGPNERPVVTTVELEQSEEIHGLKMSGAPQSKVNEAMRHKIMEADKRGYDVYDSKAGRWISGTRKHPKGTTEQRAKQSYPEATKAQLLKEQTQQQADKTYEQLVAENWKDPSEEEIKAGLTGEDLEAYEYYTYAPDKSGVSYETYISELTPEEQAAYDAYLEEGRSKGYYEKGEAIEQKQIAKLKAQKAAELKDQANVAAKNAANANKIQTAEKVGEVSTLAKAGKYLYELGGELLGEGAEVATAAGEAGVTEAAGPVAVATAAVLASDKKVVAKDKQLHQRPANSRLIWKNGQRYYINSKGERVKDPYQDRELNKMGSTYIPMHKARGRWFYNQSTGELEWEGEDPMTSGGYMPRPSEKLVQQVKQKKVDPDPYVDRPSIQHATEEDVVQQQRPPPAIPTSIPFQQESDLPFEESHHLQEENHFYEPHVFEQPQIHEPTSTTLAEVINDSEIPEEEEEEVKNNDNSAEIPTLPQTQPQPPSVNNKPSSTLLHHLNPILIPSEDTSQGVTSSFTMKPMGLKRKRGGTIPGIQDVGQNYTRYMTKALESIPKRYKTSRTPHTSYTVKSSDLFSLLK